MNKKLNERFSVQLKKVPVSSLTFVIEQIDPARQTVELPEIDKDARCVVLDVRSVFGRVIRVVPFIRGQ